MRCNQAARPGSSTGTPAAAARAIGERVDERTGAAGGRNKIGLADVAGRLPAAVGGCGTG